jgi:hypothetical protein
VKIVDVAIVPSDVEVVHNSKKTEERFRITCLLLCKCSIIRLITENLRMGTRGNTKKGKT